MNRKAHWNGPNWQFPSPSTPPVPNGDDGNPFVDPYGPLEV
jgi:hypothetical protein